MEKKLRDEAKKIVDRWRHRLFLTEWQFYVKFPHDGIDSSNSQDIVACIDADNVYKNAEILVYPTWASREKDTREILLVHELSHCVTSEARSMLFSLKNGVMYHDHNIRDLIESLTQTISRIAVGQARKPVRERPY